jgi:hypothetical protein
MRLSDWRRQAPHKESLSARVLAVVEPVLETMGTQADPECWVAWGDDPSIRYAVLAPTPAGLVLAHVRVNQPGEGPRAAAKLVRWPRVQFGELAVETQGGRRLLSFQVEGQILRGVDRDADDIGRFALLMLAVADGRPYEPPRPARRKAAPSGAGRAPARVRSTRASPAASPRRASGASGKRSRTSSG